MSSQDSWQMDIGSGVVPNETAGFDMYSGRIGLIISSTIYGFNAFVFLFYPLAGYISG
jgi:hypothetical protein